MNLAPSPSADDFNTALRSFLLEILPPGIEVVQQQDNRVAQPAGPDYVTMNEVARRRLSTNVATYADCAFSGSIVGAMLTVTGARLGRILLGAKLIGAGVAPGTAIGVQTSGAPGGTGAYTLSVAQPSPIQGVPLATGAARIVQPTEFTVQVDVYGPGAGDNATTATTLLRDDYATLWFARTGWAAKGVSVIDVGEVRQMALIDGESQFEDRYSFDVKLQADQATSPSQDFADALGVTINPPPI